MVDRHIVTLLMSEFVTRDVKRFVVRNHQGSLSSPDRTWNSRSMHLGPGRTKRTPADR